MQIHVQMSFDKIQRPQIWTCPINNRYINHENNYLPLSPEALILIKATIDMLNVKRRSL
jgi:hypothetical protein